MNMALIRGHSKVKPSIAITWKSKSNQNATSAWNAGYNWN